MAYQEEIENLNCKSCKLSIMSAYTKLVNAAEILKEAEVKK